MSHPTGHDANVTAVAASAAHNLAATGDISGGVLLWSIEPPEPRAVLSPPGGVTRSKIQGLAFSPAGTLAVSTDWTGTVELWEQERLAAAIPAYTGRATAVTWTHSGLLVTSGGDHDPDAAVEDDPFDDASPPMIGWVKLWKGAQLVQKLAVPQGTARALVVSEGDQFLAAGVDQAVVVWDLSDGEEVSRFSGVGEVTGLGFLAAGLVVTGSKGTMLATGSPPRPGQLHADVRAPAAATISEGTIVAGTYESVRILRLPEMEPLAELPGRAYGAASAGDEAWVVTSDTLLRVARDGGLVGQRSLKAP